MDDCIFCKIVRGEIPSTKVYETDQVLAFEDIDPQAPVHIVIIPKKHYKNIVELDDPEIQTEIFKAIQEIAKDKGLDEEGFRVVINTGETGGQTVDHAHAHLLGGREMQWPPG